MKKITQIPHLNYPHTQIIKFDNGESRTIRGVTCVENGKWTHIFCEGDGHNSQEYIINPDRILYVTISKEEKDK